MNFQSAPPSNVSVIPALGPRQWLRRSRAGRAWRLFRSQAKGLAHATRDPVGRGRAALQDATVARLARLARAEPQRALALARQAQRIWPRARFVFEAEALLIARLEGWAKATPFFERLAQRRAVLTGPSAAAALIAAVEWPGSGSNSGVNSGLNSGLTLALPARDRPVHLPPEAAARIVIYTAVFGDMAPPAALMQQIEGLRCLCLTDREIAVPGWETVRIAPPVVEPVRAAAWCKILPHRALTDAAPDAEASLFVEPQMRLVGNLHTLLARWLEPQAFALWRHPAASGWQDLAAWHLAAGSGGPAAGILAQARDFEAAGLPDRKGARDSRVLWRRHADPRVMRLMEAWWAAFEAQPGADELALASLPDTDPPDADLAGPRDPEPRNPGPRPAASAPVAPAVLPAAIGPADDNIFVLAAPGAAQPRASRPLPVASRRLGVAFLYAERYATYASTFLRGGQLCQMIRDRYADCYDVTWTSDAASLRDQLVIMTKGALQITPPEEIAALSARNIALVGCWADGVPEADKVAATSATMVLSLQQTLDLGRLYPQTPIFHVTHHVNRLVPRFAPPTDRLRTGYFGELPNTVRPASLAGLVELVGINTSKIETSWLDELPRFNCHWIIRNSKPIDGWKPFLKGFLAARCGAVVVVARDQNDALQYLGDDYPFFVRGLSDPELEADMVEIASAFGGPEWAHAQEIMTQVAARSSDAVVCAEFRAMVRALTE